MPGKELVKMEVSPRFQCCKVIDGEVYEDLALEIYYHAMCGELIFKNVVFKNCDFVGDSGLRSFIDCVDFVGCTFEKCDFQRTNIRWSKFKKCKFIGCTGVINWLYGVRFYNDCTFESTHIRVTNPDEAPGYFNLYKGVRKAPIFIGA